MKQHSGLFVFVTQLGCFFRGGCGVCVGGVIAQFKIMHSCKHLQALTLKVSVCLFHICRILHLAIIHEEELIAQQLIQLFPKNVLDIQNNLYQVSLACLFLSAEQLLLEFLAPQ